MAKKEKEPQLKPYDKVMIYEDPVTRKKLEDQATLLRYAGRMTSFGNEYWKVKFLNDNFICERQVNPADKV